MIRSNLYDYSDAYTLASGAMTINGTVDIYTTKQADEINLIFTWSENCVISSATGRITFLYQLFLYVTLSTEHNVKPLK